MNEKRYLAWLSRPFRKSARSNSTAETELELGVECLEKREMLAGNVAASINARGDLILKGDNLGNAVAVSQNGDSIVVKGVGTTQINGYSQVVFNDIVLLRNLKVKMRGGNDGVFVGGVSFIGNVVANMGSGSDVFQMGGDAIDGELIRDVVLGNIKVKLGSASSNPEIAFLEFLDVGGIVSIKGGSGNQNAWLGDMHSAGQIKINLGSGDDTLRISGVEAAGHKFKGGSGNVDVLEVDSFSQWENHTGFEVIRPVIR